MVSAAITPLGLATAIGAARSSSRPAYSGLSISFCSTAPLATWMRSAVISRIPPSTPADCSTRIDPVSASSSNRPVTNSSTLVGWNPVAATLPVTRITPPATCVTGFPVTKMTLPVGLSIVLPASGPVMFRLPISMSIAAEASPRPATIRLPLLSRPNSALLS